MEDLKKEPKKEELKRDDIRIMTPSDPHWPTLLREIPQPPEQLFIRGTWPIHFPDGKMVDDKTKFLCVVGARRHSDYGREACESLIAGLTGYNICIVSGLALGIDAIAHTAALAAQLPTIAFPGSGLDKEVLYPPRNIRLAKQILQAGGTLLSEYTSDTKAAPWCFPQRNRLMAGISHATLIIEATCPSGTLITSRLANEYGRDVFALPGDIFSPLSAGPHLLVHEGAALIRNSDDILHELGIKIRGHPLAEFPFQSKLLETVLGETEDEKIIYKIILEAGGKIQRDELLQIYLHNNTEYNHRNISKTSALLSNMEINSLIYEKDGTLYLSKSKP